MAHLGRRLQDSALVIDLGQLPSASPASSYHLNHSDSTLAIYNPQNEMFAAFETNRSLLKNETYPKFKKFSPGFAGV